MERSGSRPGQRLEIKRFFCLVSVSQQVFIHISFLTMQDQTFTLEKTCTNNTYADTFLILSSHSIETLEFNLMHKFKKQLKESLTHKTLLAQSLNTLYCSGHQEEGLNLTLQFDTLLTTLHFTLDLYFWATLYCTSPDISRSSEQKRLSTNAYTLSY